MAPWLAACSRNGCSLTGNQRRGNGGAAVSAPRQRQNRLKGLLFRGGRGGGAASRGGRLRQDRIDDLGELLKRGFTVQRLAVEEEGRRRVHLQLVVGKIA